MHPRRSVAAQMALIALTTTTALTPAIRCHAQANPTLPENIQQAGTITNEQLEVMGVSALGAAHDYYRKHRATLKSPEEAADKAAQDLLQQAAIIMKSGKAGNFFDNNVNDKNPTFLNIAAAQILWVKASGKLPDQIGAENRDDYVNKLANDDTIDLSLDMLFVHRALALNARASMLNSFQVENKLKKEVKVNSDALLDALKNPAKRESLPPYSPTDNTRELIAIMLGGPGNKTSSKTKSGKVEYPGWKKDGKSIAFEVVSGYVSETKKAITYVLKKGPAPAAPGM